MFQQTGCLEINNNLIYQFLFYWLIALIFTFLVEEKLKWMFKLYDKDGNGEIDPDEMEDIFTKLCKVELNF